MLCVIGEEDVGLFVCDDVDVIAVVDVVVANQENEFYFWVLQFVSLMSFKINAFDIRTCTCSRYCSGTCRHINRHNIRFFSQIPGRIAGTYGKKDFSIKVAKLKFIFFLSSTLVSRD